MISRKKLLGLIDDFLKEIKEKDATIEAIVVSDKDGMFYNQHFVDRKARNIYSHTKSFTSLLLGVAIDENKINLNDSLVNYLKNDINKEQFEKFKEIKIIDVATMTSGFNTALLMEDERRKGLAYPDYLQYIFSHELLKKPGSHFCYSNGDTYLLGRAIESAYGRTLLDLGYEKIFKPLDIGLPLWEFDPQGHTFPSSGLFLSIEDMNKLGVLILNEGEYNGQRIVSKKYIDLLYSTKVDNQGWGWGEYSLQIWHTPQGEGIRADGAHGQYTFIHPKYGFAISMQRKEDGKQDIIAKAFCDSVLNKISI